MYRDSVEIDFNKETGAFEFSPIFNMAPLFIDRHLEEGRAEKVAIITTDGREVTYRELSENVNRMGNVLSHFGLSSGDRVLIIMKDCPEFLYAFWGAVKAGYMPVPVNTILRAKDFQYFIDDSEAAVVLYSTEYRKEVIPAVKKSEHHPEIILEIGGDSKKFSNAMALASDKLTPAETTADDDCFIIYSSGSTGSPKGAVHRHKDMVVTANRMGVQTLKITEKDRFYSIAKLFFAYGMGNSMTFPLWSGGTVILSPDRPTPELACEIIEKYQPTHFFGVPTMYAGQLQVMAAKAFDFSSVRLCLSAGEGLPPEIYHQWQKMTGAAPLDGIGSTENLNHFICSPIDASKPGASGKLVPGYDAKIVDNDGKTVPVGEVGNLLIKSDSVAERYWRKPEKTAETFINGWLYTGDTYYKDEDDYYYCCGRSDDMLKVGGIWCSPFEIESKLIEHPKVLEAAVVGCEDESSLIKPKAYVTLSAAVDDEAQLMSELKQLCKKDLAPYKYPRWFEIVTELPKTSTGKIQRFKLRGV